MHRFRHRGQQKERMEKTATGITTLNQLPDETEAVIRAIPDRPLLPPLGIRPCKRVKIRTRQRFGGPLIIEIDGRRVAIPRSLASEIEISGVPHAED